MADSYDRQYLLAALPPEWSTDLLPAIQQEIAATRRKLVVLDDDPTGTQTVHDIPVLTAWSVDRLRTELAADAPAFYLLTNSRSLPLTEAQALNREIGRNLVLAGQAAQRDFDVVSRSDSTLRGHFPGEVTALAAALDQPFDGWLIIPFFLEGGRYTINDVHYVAQGEQLVQAGATEFAHDAAFGYRASNLREWVAEKTNDQIPSAAVASISLHDLRRGGPERVEQQLLQLKDGRICIVNAASMRDLQVLTLALLRAEARGQRFLYRTAASFVQVRAGLAPRPLLVPTELALPSSGGGLIVVGSYVPSTSAQVAALLGQTNTVNVEIAVAALLDTDRRLAEIERVAAVADRALRANQDVVIYTSRQLVVATDAAHSLAIGREISASLVAIVRAIKTRPRYLLAKGGITSSDIATQALDVKRAVVRGQLLPGVPVWQLGPDSRYPDLTYIVFPGNVGGPQALCDVVNTLKRVG
ncbi:MAG: hypothetical protein H0X37_11055 [Herpetosiphonaceae bacterium]|nr:hypothetical protein [Herpetosiphonaceae bacterium]